MDHPPEYTITDAEAVPYVWPAKETTAVAEPVVAEPVVAEPAAAE